MPDAVPDHHLRCNDCDDGNDIEGDDDDDDSKHDGDDDDMCVCVIVDVPTAVSPPEFIGPVITDTGYHFIARVVYNGTVEVRVA